MLTVEEARARIIAPLAATGPEVVPLVQASGRVSASAIVARRDQPAEDLSAMDGYAVRAADGIAGAELRVIGTAPAGHPFEGRVEAGEALRIFTGSPVPAGADAVVLQEDVSRHGDRVTLSEPAVRGRHVRPRAGDFASGDVLIEPGVRLGARAVALVAAANHPWLAVRRKPVVALLATGDEVVWPGEPIGPGGLPSSNSVGLAAMVEGAGGVALSLPIVPDDLEAITAAARAVAHADLLVTLGGASVGDHDLVRPALARLGFAPDVLRIALRPGKPLTHGEIEIDGRRVPVLGVPGNPVSALVCAVLFLRPAIDRLLGLPDRQPTRHRLRLRGRLPANDGRADHMRGVIEGQAVLPLPAQDSSRLRDLARADALILRAPYAPEAADGDEVDVLRLEELGI